MSTKREMTCEEALRLLAEHLDGELDAADARDVDEHIRTCRSCYSRAEFERRLKERVGALREQAVQPEFESRVRALIGRFTTSTQGR